MTERIYWRDAYRTAFDAQVIDVCAVEGKPAVVLERTCFYPTSGGQPYDTGTLNEVRVVEVFEQDERIVHVLDAPLPLGPVSGGIDWPRRFDHMQQHSGQHVLSQAWLNLAHAETVSFHLGLEACTIDIALASAPDSLVDAVEDLANQVIWDNLAVSVHEYAPDGLTGVPLRKAPQVSGTVRVVAVGAFDYSACGGTHVRAAGEIGSIHIAGMEKRRGQLRVSFVCGGRALHTQREARRNAQASALLLSVHPAGLPAAVAHMLDETHTLQKQNEELSRRLLLRELPIWWQQGAEVAGWRIIAQTLEYPPALLRQAAQELARRERTIALLASQPPNAQFCFAASPEAQVNMGALLRQVLQPFGGKGGGSASLAQGGGVGDEAVTQVLSQAYQALTNQIN